MPPETPATPLIVQVQRHARAAIDTELHRLARRIPTLRGADLDIIDATLDELAESLLLARLRTAPQHLAPSLTRLFGTPAECTASAQTDPTHASERTSLTPTPIRPLNEPAS
jgi:hypothetical protein